MNCGKNTCGWFLAVIVFLGALSAKADTFTYILTGTGATSGTLSGSITVTGNVGDQLMISDIDSLNITYTGTTTLTWDLSDLESDIYNSAIDFGSGHLGDATLSPADTSGFGDPLNPYDYADELQFVKNSTYVTLNFGPYYLPSPDWNIASVGAGLIDEGSPWSLTLQTSAVPLPSSALMGTACLLATAAFRGMRRRQPRRVIHF